MWYTLFRGYTHQIVRKKRTFDRVASNNDTLVDLAVIAYPIHINYGGECQ